MILFQISLYKFVRLAGDLLPPPLYIPYIRMLAGLATGPNAAHHTYSLLKSNGQSGGEIIIRKPSWILMI